MDYEAPKEPPKIGISLPIRELKEDIGAIKAFAQQADELGYTHLRVPDLVLRPNSRHLHEPLISLAYVAAVTERIELVPSVIVAPARQTVLLVKQVTTLAQFSGDRVRLGIGVGDNADEYEALGEDFHTRGRRCEEQIRLIRELWRDPEVFFIGDWHRVMGTGLNPMPRKNIPIWIGASGLPAPHIRERIGKFADGWFVLCGPEDFAAVKADVDRAAKRADRFPITLGTEAGVAVVGPRESEWQRRVAEWRRIGLSHICLRTLGAGLTADEHIAKAREAWGIVNET